MMAMLKQLDAGSFFFSPLLSVFIFLALVLKVFRNRFSCHDQIVAEPVPSKLSNFNHSVKFLARHKTRTGGLGGLGKPKGSMVPQESGLVHVAVPLVRWRERSDWPSDSQNHRRKRAIFPQVHIVVRTMVCTLLSSAVPEKTGTPQFFFALG